MHGIWHGKNQLGMLSWAFKLCVTCYSEDNVSKCDNKLFSSIRTERAQFLGQNIDSFDTVVPTIFQYRNCKFTSNRQFKISRNHTLLLRHQSKMRIIWSYWLLRDMQHINDSRVRQKIFFLVISKKIWFSRKIKFYFFSANGRTIYVTLL